MNKFLLVLLTILFVSALSFRVNVKNDDHDEPTEEDLEELAEACHHCFGGAHHQSKLQIKIKHDDELDCEDLKEICDTLAHNDDHHHN